MSVLKYILLAFLIVDAIGFTQLVKIKRNEDEDAQKVFQQHLAEKGESIEIV